MATLACDWDGTLVDSDQRWLPYAEESLRALTRDGHTVIVHSCRANWPEGLASIYAKLQAAHLPIEVWVQAGKPDADLYLDDRAVFFNGDWPTLLGLLREATSARVEQAMQVVGAVRPAAGKPKGKRPGSGKMWS